MTSIIVGSRAEASPADAGIAGAVRSQGDGLAGCAAARRSSAARRGGWDERRTRRRSARWSRGSVTPLWSDPSLSEQAMQLGKVQNLRRAAAALDGLVLAAGPGVQLLAPGRAGDQGAGLRARPHAARGLHDAGDRRRALPALQRALRRGAAGRLPDRRAPRPLLPVPGSAAEAGRDATVAWNYVDLRFARRAASCCSASVSTSAS